MTVTVNGKEYFIPYSLSDIPLGRFIKYYDDYGRDLDKELDEILKRDYNKLLTEKGYHEVTESDIELHKQLDLDNHLDNEALAWHSYWTGHDFFEVKQEKFITPVLSQYRLLKHLLIEGQQKASYEFPLEIIWNGDVWQIQEWTVTPASEMTANEIFTSKEIMLQVHNLGLSRWHSLVYLCAVFLRKKDEKFTDKLVMDGSERMELMKTLPLEHALKVSFFLNACVGIWKNTLVYSTEREAEIANLN
jgi:hypothetical protein